MIGLEAPRHGELAEIRRIDLIERRIARVTGVAAIGSPFAVQRARLAVEADGGNAQGHEGDTQHSTRRRTHGAPCFLSWVMNGSHRLETPSRAVGRGIVVAPAGARAIMELTGQLVHLATRDG